jgi:putative ATP-dependent endonuclease of OLD family
VENALAETLRQQSEPVLALEEPEAHLHPQAGRSLWSAISRLPGQKIVTTHSPFFAQNVPFEQIVLLRRSDRGSEAISIPRAFEVQVEGNDELVACVTGLDPEFKYNADTKTLTGRRELSTAEYQNLLMCYTGPDRAEPHSALRAFYEKSKIFICDDDLRKLESFARRIRGEIFFARKWLLCEGQSEYAIIGAAAELLGDPVDAHGIAIIDYQNNGSPGIFATAARALHIPWSMICDGDQGGNAHIEQLRSKNFSGAEIDDRVVQLPANDCLEDLIIRSPLRALMLEAVRELDVQVEDTDAAVLAFAKERKEETAVRLSARMRASASRNDLPAELVKVFQLIGETDEQPQH